jgi:hypothetical protein
VDEAALRQVRALPERHVESTQRYGDANLADEVAG